MRNFSLILCIPVFFTAFQVSGQTADAVLHISDAKTVINRNIYGHFAEHLGSLYL